MIEKVLNLCFFKCLSTFVRIDAPMHFLEPPTPKITELQRFKSIMIIGIVM